jgi:hypothetical protein
MLSRLQNVVPWYRFSDLFVEPYCQKCPDKNIRDHFKVAQYKKQSTLVLYHRLNFEFDYQIH